MSVTQADVALLAGVSRKTVSNVINDYPHVSPDVLRRVEEAIEKLGYTPSHAARSLRLGRTRVIQLVIPELEVPYFAELAHMVVEAAEEFGLNVVITETLGDVARERDALEGLAVEYAEGTILSPVGATLESIARSRSTKPVVLIGERRGQGRVEHVGIDDVDAARTATEHLLALGRRRIAFIGAADPGRLPMADMRSRGYLNAIQTAGIDADPSLVVATAAYHRADGEMAMRGLLEAPRRPDAVFCATDLLAIGAMRAIYDAGLTIPEDIAVVGLDGLEEGRYSVPSLTTISPDKTLIARSAVRILAARLDAADDFEVPADVLVPFTLIERESTRGR